MMPLRGTALMAVTVIVLLAISGCSQPDKTVLQTPLDITPGSTASPLQVSCQTAVIPAATGITTVTPYGQSYTASFPPDQTVTGNYQHYAGTDYSLDYPATWGINVTTLPLREYHHNSDGCTVTLAYELDQELRFFYSGDNTTIFSSSVVDTQRDIWPRDQDLHVDYADIVNSILGDPDYCANTPMGAFTISDVTDVPLTGVYYKGIRVDFGKINATGFTDGTGTAYIVTGVNRRGVFIFYTSSQDPVLRYTTSGYMFNSLRLDPGF
ncbi:hypothetical protein [Methanoregula sp.]|uniref:hypothetical protein n=1 Tax=Methanoregula sp. TaxID=2052170 RepID=UPI003C74EB13